MIQVGHLDSNLAESVSLRGHFANDRDAALAYNWLSRQKNLSLFIKAETLLTAQQGLFLSPRDHPEAEKWSINASILDAFHELFPDGKLIGHL